MELVNKNNKIRLDQALVMRGLCASRTEAQELIQDGNVLMNGNVCTKQTSPVKESDKLLVMAKRKYVSRGGEKLRGVLNDVFGDDESVRVATFGRHALDIGSSTGGFTDCLLQFGIEHVDAVDVGTQQLHQSLCDNSKVFLFENTDIRNFNSCHSCAGRNTGYDFIVADLSFISIETVLKDLIRLGTKNITKYFILIKPQFEVGKGNTKKGIVKNEELVQEVLKKIKNECESFGMIEIKIFLCHLKGGDGNQEYFLFGKL